ncbi:MAG: hypothetical protein H0V51_19430 [Chloroflexi bacterium]|nr:hypothetical protein [Chloroflexota bacterium]
MRPFDVDGEAGPRSAADGGDGAPKGIRAPAATADIEGWARLPSQPPLSHVEATPPPSRPEPARAPLQPTLPQFTDDERALRERVLHRCLDVLRSTGPLTARELAKRLAPFDARTDKRLVNSILWREGAGDVRCDAARYTYGILPRRG